MSDERILAELVTIATEVLMEWLDAHKLVPRRDSPAQVCAATAVLAKPS